MSVLQALRFISLIVFTAKDLLGTGMVFCVTVLWFDLKMGQFKVCSPSLAEVLLNSTFCTSNELGEVH
jgi:hypothetical protein